MMKVTREDLKKIIKEELEAVLSEESALQPDTIENTVIPDPDEKSASHQSFSADLLKLAKELKSNPEMRKNLSPQELEELEKMFKGGLELATNPDKKNAQSYLSRINDRIEDEQGKI